MNTGSQSLLIIALILALTIYPVFAAPEGVINPVPVSSGALSNINPQIPDVKQVLDTSLQPRQLPIITPPASGNRVISLPSKSTVNKSISESRVSENYTSQMNLTNISSANLISRTRINGKLIDQRITGPGLPPKGWKTDQNLPRKSSISVSGLQYENVPTMSWSYGCSPTSATMLFGYYDQIGYSNMYVGPTNGGVFPSTNAVWAASDGTGQCPLTASQYGLDGRTTKGHKDDYFYAYGSAIDPYYSGSWAEHTPKDSICDFMGTNMYKKYSNVDGSTTFWYYTDGSPTEDFTYYDSTRRDGMHGMRLFAESRGYSVITNYNQYIYGFQANTKGFTYAQYKAEIDAGYPVIIQLNGHTVLGVGYSGTNEMIIHDTWDYKDHVMTWGGSYAGLQHLGVGVIHLTPVPFEPLLAKFYGVPDTIVFPLKINFYDASTGSPTSWNWDFGDENNITTQNASYTFMTVGTHTVTLTVTKDSSSSNSKSVITYEPGIYPDS